ncbi:hypothetical protein TL16_g10815 [Triparma laevis f. inornata]|uniref:PH domain-containing protein n=1 Tax=Triparma laevis f. inornata TaxID=1714386 RepID=A0A9W7EQR0_9STRA|nr:hypothetical protein TL16_g10815 [Triparma laevis f. inornata]
MKDLSSESGKEGGEGVLLSASRESKLTQILGPLLSGNCRTWFLGFLSKGEGKGGECMETLKTLGLASNVMSGCIKNVNKGDNYGDRGGVDYISAVKLGEEVEDNKLIDGESGDISEDSIDEGDKWLNEFKIRREAIVNSPVKKSPVKSPSPPPPAKVKPGKGGDDSVGSDENSDRRRSYALTGGKKEPNNKKGLIKRQSTLIVGEGGVANAGSDGASPPEGWLWKKGQKRHNWKQRFFSIEGPMLVYYKDQNKSTKLGSVDLRGAKVDVVKHAKNDFAFDLTVPVDNGVVVRHLHAESEIERIRWLLNLEGILAEQLMNTGLGGEGGGEWSEGEEEEGEEQLEEKANATTTRDQSFSLTNALDSLMDDDAEGDRVTVQINNRADGLIAQVESVNTIEVDVNDGDDEPSIPTLEHLASSEDFGVLSNNKKVNLLVVGEGDDKSDGSSMLSSVRDDGASEGEGDSRVGELPTSYVANSSSNQTSSHSHSQYSMPSLSTPASSISPELLQSNYDTLLSMLREERRIRNKMNDKIANTEHTLLETSTAYQIEVDDLKMKNAEVTRKFNKLGRESAYKEVFMQFEEEIKKTAGREEQMQERNVALEMEVRLLHVSKTQNTHHQNSMLKMGDDLKLNKQKARNCDERSDELGMRQFRSSFNCLHGLHLKKADLESGLMHAEREAAMWRQAHATLEGDNARLQNELTKATADVMKYKHAAKNNNLIQRFLDKHAPKPTGGGKGKGGESLHTAVQSLAADVRRTCPALMSSVALVANKIEDEVNLGRHRERDLMHSMVELLDENVENIEGGVQGFRERKIAVAQRVMLGK